MPKNIAPRIRFFRNTRGQAMTEFCVAMPALVLMFWAIWYISDVYIVKYKTLVAARYGTWLLARDNDLEQSTVNEFIARRFFDDESDDLTVTAQHRGGSSSGLEDAAGENSENGEWVDDIISAIGSAFMGSDSPSMHSLKVEYEVPLIFGALNIGDYAMENPKITSEHYVVGNTWNGCQSDVHEMFGMMWSIISDLFGGLFDMIGGGGDEDYGEERP